jgi:hypothetical protein
VDAADTKTLAGGSPALLPSSLPDSRALTAGEAIWVSTRRRQPRDQAAAPSATTSLGFPLSRHLHGVQSPSSFDEISSPCVSLAAGGAATCGRSPL